MRPCAVVPTHDHWTAIGNVVARLRAAGLPVFVVDDGSAEPAAAAIAALYHPEDEVHVHRLPVNRGKGAAVLEGFRLARQAGFTHAVQVDADGQHDLGALPDLLALAERHPTALVSGQPVYDASVPAKRRIGRWVTHIWVWFETLSFQITDSMCGFRVYPLAPVEALLAEEHIGWRMEFDIEIMVRLFWRGTPVVTLPVKVVYPPGNASHFRPLRDNLRISLMHAWLMAGMVRRRFPARRHREFAPGERHWSALAERGAYWGLAFATFAYRLFGRRGCLVVLAPVVLWFLLTGREQRQASRSFLARTLGRPAGLRDCYRHFMSFAGRTLDTFAGWTGGIRTDAICATDPKALANALADPRGALIVVAHLGNVELARALLDDATRARLTVLVHTRHAPNYERVLREFRAAAAVNLIQVTEIGPETAILLRQRIERGEWLVIAGDRTPVDGGGRVDRIVFLGAEAAFSHGPWILAALLACPVHLLFCLQEGDGWQLTLERFAERIDLPRRGRDAVLRDCAARYAARLEEYARRAPFQWYNFFDFWAR